MNRCVVRIPQCYKSLINTTSKQEATRSDELFFYSSSMARYQYTPLPATPNSDSIRLAAIRLGIGTDDVVVDLHIQSFMTQSPPVYEALSYVWGSTKLFEVIYVGESNEQRPADKAALPVTRSLKIALQHLRYPDQERIMWIDAICIDQSNNIEKGPQVAMMGQLFECASHVVV